MNFKLVWDLVSKDLWIVYFLLVSNYIYKLQNITLLHFIFEKKDDEKTFTQILFYGEENSLLIWNTITFLFIDFLSSNYVLAAIITYVLNLVSITHLWNTKT
jgi:hypothetical protein